MLGVGVEVTMKGYISAAEATGLVSVVLHLYRVYMVRHDNAC